MTGLHPRRLRVLVPTYSTRSSLTSRCHSWPVQAHTYLHTYFEVCGPAAFDITAPPPPERQAPACELPNLVGKVGDNPCRYPCGSHPCLHIQAPWPGETDISLIGT